MKKLNPKAAAVKTHRCPFCGHKVPLTSTGNFRSHQLDGGVRKQASQSFCKGSSRSVRDGVVYDIDNKPIDEK